MYQEQRTHARVSQARYDEEERGGENVNLGDGDGDGPESEEGVDEQNEEEEEGDDDDDEYRDGEMADDDRG